MSCTLTTRRVRESWMPWWFVFAATFFCMAPAHRADPADPAPPRLKRADSFLGMHFDFHAGEDCTEVGKNTTPEMIENIINLVKPDYLQIDCKGHPGVSSYPTKVGHPVPGFVGDPLKVWREVTARRGVSLYMHYSGVFDSHAVRQPGWAAMNANGKPSDRATSFFGPYADQLLIPQLRELAGEYGVDGVWVDGDCWAAVVDYSEPAARAFREATGITTLPKHPGEPNWYEFLQFHRQAYRNYLNHYVTEVKRTHPQFQICSNWAFTDHMPERVSAPVDFLSGDYSPEDSVNSARLAGRFLTRQGVPWDLMAWSFATRPTHAQKTAVQLQREAAVVLALGGGFQAYFKQKRDGSIFDEQMPVMAEVAKFCRARQKLSHRAQAVPQIALLFSTHSHYRELNGLFSRDNERVAGVLNALLENQHSVEIQAEHHLHGRMGEYPLIVVPEWSELEPQFVRELLDYVEAGGSLLVVGPESVAQFAEPLDITLTDDRSSSIRLQVGDKFEEVPAAARRVTLGARALSLGNLKFAGEPEGALSPAASVTPFGRGRIAAIYFALGRSYWRSPSPAVRTLMADVVREVFPNPVVRVQGSHEVDVCLTRKDGKRLVHLINTAGPHRTQPILDSIPAVGPLDIIITQDVKPTRISLQPSGLDLPFKYENGEVRLVVPTVAIHEIVVLDGG